MISSDIKNAIGKLQPDPCMEYRLAEKLKNRRHQRFIFKPAIIAASLMIAVFAVLYAGGLVGQPVAENQLNATQINSVYLPKAELNENAGAKGKMKGLIVYQGRIYLQSALQLDPHTAETLVGEKIGKTKGNITEWSKQVDYATELASTTGIQDVYSVKGYDKSFRIMTYEKSSSGVYTQFYECLNDITVKTGEDIFGKLGIKGNINTATYELFDSWNNGKQEIKAVTNLSRLNDFIDVLYKSVPYAEASLSDLWEDQSENCQKFINLSLKDGTQVQLRIFKDGYVYYNSINIFFKLEQSEFTDFWNELV